MRSTGLFVSVLVLFGLATLPVRAEDSAAATDSLGRPVMAASLCPGPVPAGLSGVERASSPWGLEFAVGPNLTLRSAQGNTLSLLRRLDERRRLRMGISVSGSFEAFDADNSTRMLSPADSTVSQTRREEETSMGSLGLFVQRQWLGAATGRSGALVGLGPDLIFSVGDRRYVTSHPEHGDLGTTTYQQTVFSFGLLGSLGGEWRFAGNLALQACYNLRMARSWEWTEQESSSTNTNEATRHVARQEDLEQAWRLSNFFTFSLCAWF
jgi:hypothetical protein